MKLALIHRSVGFAKDSRIRKLVTSFQKQNFSIDLCLWDRTNEAFVRRLPKNTTVYNQKLVIASSSVIRGGVILSIVEIIQEFFQGLVFLVKTNPDVVIVQNHRQILHLASCFLHRSVTKKCGTIVWDLREIPTGFHNSKVLTFLFNKFATIPDYIWVMNEGRKNFMLENFNLKNRKLRVVPNFCDLSYWEKSKKELSVQVSDFLAGEQYVYIQNPFNASRYGRNSISAVLQATDLKIVVSGNIETVLHRELGLDHSLNEIERRVLFVGSIQEEELLPLIDNCSFSIVLYSSDTTNNWHCDANRFYQCIARGVPVVVGANPGLADFVRKYDLGVVLSDDGRCKSMLEAGITKLISDFPERLSASAVSRAKAELHWEVNEHIFKSLTERYPE